MWMFVPGDNDVINSDESYKTGGAQTDRVNGEYHYKNGYTQKIYSDAHYVREEDSTVPPRYYSPHEKPAREPKEPKPARESGRRAGAFARTLCLCLVCALLGGLGGAAFIGSRMTDRMEALEQSVTQLQNQPAIGQGSPLAVGVADGEQGAVPASAVYDMACQQVVGVTSEVNYTNFFGMTSSSAVSGSGFIVSENGYIITNYHVIEGAKKITVDVDGGNYTVSEIVDFSKVYDLAILKIEKSDTPYLERCTEVKTG